MNYLSNVKRLGAVALVAFVMGCGGSDNGPGVSSVADAGGGSDTGSVLQTIVIAETEFKLEPSAVTLNAPGTYIFRAENRGRVVHTLSIRDGVTNSLMTNLDPNQNGDLMVSLQAGNYTMFCPIPGHEQLGMTGTIVVKPSS